MKILPVSRLLTVKDLGLRSNSPKQFPKEVGTEVQLKPSQRPLLIILPYHTSALSAPLFFKKKLNFLLSCSPYVLCYICAPHPSTIYLLLSGSKERWSKEKAQQGSKEQSYYYSMQFHRHNWELTEKKK